MKKLIPFGSAAIEFGDNGLCRLSWCGKDAPQRTSIKPEEKRLQADLERYFAGERVSFLRYRLDLSSLSEFSRQVLLETRRIPYGERCSYGEIAKRIGRPKAARAVGQALKRNPIVIVIPCHRVVGNDGDLRGFAGGIQLKTRLLALESGHDSRK